MRSVLLPLGPLYEPNVSWGTVGSPIPDDSNTARTDTTSGTSNDTSLSCTRLPNTLLDVSPSPIPSLTPEFDLDDPDNNPIYFEDHSFMDKIIDLEQD